MKALTDRDNALTRGLAAIRAKFQVPEGFPPEVEAAAGQAAARAPTEHTDRTALPFVTLDPATSTDLDQAFHIERAGADILLRYAIADIAWFVEDGGVIDREAWNRGTTLYLPDGKAGLYPQSLSENAASLLPDGPRPAVIFTVRVAPDGEVRLDGAERAIIHSRAKLAYDSVTDADLPEGFADLARRMHIAEARRGAARVDPPEQQVERVEGDGYALTFRPYLASEENNAALSLACNLAIADALLAHHTGLFRVMAAPDDQAVNRLRHTARAFRLDWPHSMPLKEFERSLRAQVPAEAAFMLAIRRAGQGASYAPYAPSETPWHAAMAATYAHATAPLRRLADRYVVRAALALANGEPVPQAVTEAFAKLPPVMARADALAGKIDRAVIDLAEAVMLHGREGETFAAIVTDVTTQGFRVQLRDLPVVANLKGAAAAPGDRLTLRLAAADTLAGTIAFAAA
ncbi:MAG: RNB domain-containing ribonuclease [Sphingomonas sp.]|uniref:RNB domain-containing ribonuclease n=1 Tax=Sphingomonas sp. TaxID=28214 RepID=UPI0025FD2C6E|nr:RNB domain-containing ribonuclease [Sphingomonas sp.]MBX3566079.1 RNB domain-containing ribonuclease [Sphingomonas sp.]